MMILKQASEQENDAAIAHMAERAGMLRAVTIEMQGEVDAQNKLLDSMVSKFLGFFRRKEEMTVVDNIYPSINIILLLI